ncbi:uncharacterized protein [Salmo salar]|uniref:Uncharacterized protein LOC106611540 n=1 Tax=Salmo salar TaxID=8030 RepID=A0A1S3SSP9_SALSA|nr:uncharacterized protein LOC106611540 [Salmo salar]XP_045570149.1 uncharacterized protein LOC106611540 [Salmo salar]|eukprot:XP_014067354.1 PREDICTED: uncharacterized protein LOC106611540 isoform X1 [Salmo salar]
MATTNRQQQHSLPGFPDDSLVESSPSSVDKLAFKYMELCKVESSTDSESDVSPRWSDTSTMGCGSSAPESRQPIQRMLTCSHKPVGRYSWLSLSLDPYDGSSEDSDESNAGPRRPRQGSCRYWGRSQRRNNHPPTVILKEVIKSGGPTEPHLIDVQMRSASDSELWTCSHSKGRGPVTSADSGVLTIKSSPCTPVFPTLVGAATSVPNVRIPEKSPDNTIPLRGVFKRKLSLPGAETLQDCGHRKKQCVTKMEAGDSPPEGSWSMTRNTPLA